MTQWLRKTSLVLILILFIGVCRIYDTYDEYYHVTDELMHIAAGMEWIENGTYKTEELHPPLTRVFIAALPYLAGHRIGKVECPESFVDGYNRIKKEHKKGFFESFCLQDQYISKLINERYSTLLKLARIGMLPFYLVTVLVTYFLGRQWYNSIVGLIAAFIIAMEPVILGSSSFALTDMGIVAMHSLAVLLFYRWIMTPSLRLGCSLAIITGICLLAKFSGLLYLFVSFLIILGHRAIKERSLEWFRALLNPGMIGVMLGILFLVLWGGYRFSMGSAYDTFPGLSEKFPAMAGPSIIHKNIIPMPEFFRGILMLQLKNEKGHSLYFLGTAKYGDTTWYFFLLLLLVKTLFLTLFLWCASIIHQGISIYNKKENTNLLPYILPVGLVFAASFTNINIGLRHVLVIYPFIAISVAIFLFYLSQRVRKGEYLVGVILFLLLIDSFSAQPGNSYYFNILAGKNPEYITVDGDLDNGQSFKPITSFLREHNIKKANICGYINYHFDAEKFSNPDPDIDIKSSCDRPAMPGWLIVRARSKVMTPDYERNVLLPAKIKQKIDIASEAYYFE